MPVVLAVRTVVLGLLAGAPFSPALGAGGDPGDGTGAWLFSLVLLLLVAVTGEIVMLAVGRRSRRRQSDDGTRWAGATERPADGRTRPRPGTHPSPVAPPMPRAVGQAQPPRVQAYDLFASAEELRVQTRFCVEAARTLDETAREMDGAGDVLSRRAGYAHSRTLVLRKSLEEAMEHVCGLLPQDGTPLDTGASDVLHALLRAMEECDHSVTATADLGAAARRSGALGERLRGLCTDLEPALRHASAVAHEVVDMSVELDDDAGGWAPARRTRDGVPGGGPSREGAQAEVVGNVVYARFGDDAR